MKSSLSRYSLVGGIILGAVLVAGFLVSMKPQPPKKDIVELDPLIETLILENMTANFEVRSQGTVRPRTETVLSSVVSGTITSISPKFIAGGVFDRNEVLMRIDPTNYEVAVKQAVALVKQRQIEFDGATKLRSQGYRAEAELASAAAALATAEAESVRARRNLERTYIRLPYEGIVRAKETDLGQFVSTGTRLGIVFATDFAEVRLPLTDSDLAFVHLPDAAEVSAGDAVDGPAVVLSATQKGKPVEWEARIVRSEGVVDEKSRVTYAVARFDDPYRRHSDGPSLPMGTFVSAVISGSSAEEIIRVPRSIIRGSDELIFVDDESKLRIRQVELVRTDSEYAYVGSGAVAGEEVVVTSLEAPVNGMPVRTGDDESAGSDDQATVNAEASE